MATTNTQVLDASMPAAIDAFSNGTISGSELPQPPQPSNGISAGGFNLPSIKNIII
jgi:hypothetical protein